MTDEFNLVPTNNLEKHLDNILRAASGEEPQYDLAPSWRIEQYLAAIASALASGGGSDGGGITVVHETTTNPSSKGNTKGGAAPDEPGGTTTYYLDKTWKEIADAMRTGVVVLVSDVRDTEYSTVISAVYYGGSPNKYRIRGYAAGAIDPANYLATSKTAYPSYEYVN